MADHNGTMTGQSGNHLAEDKSPGMFEDDSHIRDWVQHHTNAEIRNQITHVKIQMIRVLLTGRISDKDVTTIGIICRCVIDATQADALRTALSQDITSMTSIHQRTRVRLFFAQMPRLNS